VTFAIPEWVGTPTRTQNSGSRTSLVCLLTPEMEILDHICLFFCEHWLIMALISLKFVARLCCRSLHQRIKYFILHNSLLHAVVFLCCMVLLTLRTHCPVSVRAERARVKCGPADRPAGKLRTRSADHVRSLPVGWSAGTHYLYKSFFPVADICIITALDVAYLRSFTCHMGSHRLKVVIKNGDSFLLENNFRITEHHLPYGTSKLCNTCNVVILPPVKKGHGKNSHSTDKVTWVEWKNCSRWHHCRYVRYQRGEFVCELCWQFFIDIWRFTCLSFKWNSLELSLCNINKHNTHGLRLQIRWRHIINYIKLNSFYTYNCLHCSSKRLNSGLKHEYYSIVI